MGWFKHLALPIAAGAAAAGALVPANAQCRLCDKPTTMPDRATSADQLQLDIETSIDFDRLVLLGSGDGAAMLRPDGPNAAQGTISNVSPRAMVGSASIHGAPNRAVRVELPARIDLYSTSGGRISFDEIVSDLSSAPRLDSAGNLKFRFGGRVHVTGDADGQYRGNLPITVEYL